MTHPAPCLNQLADDIESHGNMLALLTSMSDADLSTRGRIGLIQLSSSVIKDFEDIEKRFQTYRASLNPSC